MSICEHCVSGHVLPGEPKGSFHDGAYLHPGPEGTTRAVVLLTDIFGLPLKNCKITADRLSERLGCDVWIPDVFDGKPPVKESELSPLLADQPGHKLTIGQKLSFVWLLLTHLFSFIAIFQSSKIDARVTKFLDGLKEQKKYEKIGAVGYCFGGAILIRLAQKKYFDSGVIAHPGQAKPEHIRAIDIPTSWICAEEDQSFGPELRNATEAILAERKDKPEFVDYEFVDYKGTTHGFAARPNLGIPEIKEAFEKSFEQTVHWFEKTL